VKHRLMACTVCGNDGHNKRTCKLKLRELEESLLEGFDEVSDGEAVVESALVCVNSSSHAEDNVVREDEEDQESEEESASGDAGKKSVDSIIWEEIPIASTTTPIEDFKVPEDEQGFQGDKRRNYSILDVFLLCFPLTCFEEIVRCTNLRATNEGVKGWKELTTDECFKFFAVILYCGISRKL
jgi:hypothetical protein